MSSVSNVDRWVSAFLFLCWVVVWVVCATAGIRDAWLCSCGATFSERLGMCPLCFRVNSFRPYVGLPGEGREPLPPEKVTAVELLRRSRRQTRPAGVWREVLPAGIQAPCLILIFGPPGAGKTSLALMMADAWSHPSIVLSFELGLGPSLASLVARLEIMKPDFACVESWADIPRLVEEYDLVVVDSLQQASLMPDYWRRLTVDRGKLLILTSQVNSEGEVRGGLAGSHLADIVIELPGLGAFRLRKNRFGPIVRGTWT